MTHRALLRIAFAATAVALSATARATTLDVTSYDMLNGDGQAHGGSYNYWDGTYNGSGNKFGDGSYGNYLSGGTGVLTDGIVSSQIWSNVSNSAGTGEYVGWNGFSPTITFHFGSAVTVNELSLAVDNSHYGGVYAPSGVIVNGTYYDNPTWVSASGLQTIAISGLNLTGESVTVQLVNSAYWVFLSEATFTTAVPEPGSTALMLAGLGIVALRTRRRAR